MNIKELKKKIESNDVLPSTMIWNVPDDQSMIIVSQYLNRICDNKNLNLKYIDSYLDIPDQSFVEDNNLYVIKNPSDIKLYNNLVIICKDNKSKEAIKFPKLEDWEVVDYISTKCPGLEEKISEYVKLSKGNYWKVINDFDRLSLFSKESQSIMMNIFEKEGQFIGYTDKKIFDVSNAIIRRDINSLLECLKIIDYIDVNPMALISLLYNGFKNVISVQMSQSQPEWLDSKQYYVVKKFNCGHYSNDELMNIFEILTNIEYKFKYESLSLQQVIDYLIINVIGG